MTTMENELGIAIWSRLLVRHDRYGMILSFGRDIVSSADLQCE